MQQGCFIYGMMWKNELATNFIVNDICTPVYKILHFFLFEAKLLQQAVKNIDVQVPVLNYFFKS